MRVFATALTALAVALFLWSKYFFFHPDPFVVLLSALFSVLVVGRAVYVFWVHTSNRHLASFLAHFLVFPIVFWFNPVDLILMASEGRFCPRGSCEGAGDTEIAQTFITEFVVLRIPIIAWEFAFFMLLFVLAQIAAGRLRFGSRETNTGA